MDMRAFRQYLQLNRKRLGPSAGDLSDPQLLEAYKQNIRAIAQADSFSHDFVREMRYDQRERFSYPVLSIGECILMIAVSPVAFFLLLKSSGFTQQEFALPFASVGLIAYLFPLIYLFIRAYFLKPPFLYLLLMTITLGVCAYTGGYRGHTLFGSEQTWLYVAMVCCTLITLCYRLHLFGSISRNIRIYKGNVKKTKESNHLISQTLEMFAHLGDDQAGVLQHQYPNIKLTPRTPWFHMPRKYNPKNGSFFKPYLREVPTDFTKPFESTSATKEYGTVTGETFRIVEQQSFGYETITNEQLIGLIKEGQVFPFYNWGLPILPGNLSISMFRHSWTINVSTYYSGYRDRVEQRDSQAQIDFDIRMMDVESYYLGKTADHYLTEAHDPNDVYYVDQYVKKREKKREEIGYDHVTVRKEVNQSHKYTEQGDEIGAVTIRAKDGELLGMYCGNSRQAIEAAYRILRKETGFQFSETLSCNGSAQAAYLYQMYLNA